MGVKNITREKISNIGLIFLASVVFIFFVGGTWLCRIYALGIGVLTVWAGIESLFNSEISLLYLYAGTSNPLPLFQFNPGLGNFCIGWGIIFSVIINLRKGTSDKFHLIGAVIFGMTNLIVGLINFLGMPSEVIVSVPRFWTSFLSIYIGLSIVYVVTSSWEAAK
jgi:hypothetical protein